MANDPALPCSPPRTPVSFQKNIALFGVAGIHLFHPGTLFNFKGLNKNQVLHDRQNYHIIIYNSV